MKRLEMKKNGYKVVRVYLKVENRLKINNFQKKNNFENMDTAFNDLIKKTLNKSGGIKK